MNKYDIIIAGGGTAGCAAAYTAGRLGFKTLLVEKNIHLGGAVTSALVIPCMNAGENQINTDFYNALIKKLKKLGGQITYQNNSGWFNPELTKIALDNLMHDANVEVMFSAKISDVNISHDDKNIIKSVKILSEYTDTIQKELSEPIEARYVIDTTGNCEICELAGCNFLNENENKTQPVSLRFIMSNINLKAFSEWLIEFDKDRDVTTAEYIEGAIHLSTAYTWDTGKNWALKPLFDDAVAKGILKDTDRNYFQIFTIAGMPDAIAFNCPRMIENSDYSAVLRQARQSIFRLADFCKKYFKGFENAYISNIADELGIRVSRRLKGKYVYTAQDLKSGKTFDNPVVISNYPIDIHSEQKDASKLVKTGYYQLPVESLMSADIENLFVAGRCLSADFEAQAALRIQPNCFAMGEGIVKYIKSL